MEAVFKMAKKQQQCEWHFMKWAIRTQQHQSKSEIYVQLELQTIKYKKRSKAMDMRFHWIRNIINQGHYIVYWIPGYTNKAD